MRFQDMPYERIDFAKVQEEMGELIRELDAAKSGEEQFEVHKKILRDDRSCHDADDHCEHPL